MKFAFIALSLLLTHSAFSQTLKEERVRKEMLERVEKLITNVDEARDHLENEDVAATCENIQKLFKLYPEHLTNVGQHMNMLSGKSSQLKDVILQELIMFHKQSNACNSKDNENVDPKKLKKQLKSVSKSLNKQKRVIEKKDTDFENRFEYHYEF